jgi:exodeoxyribonuclease VII large subunit
METKYYTISALNKAIKNMFDEKRELNNIHIKGEISNFKHHSRGHLYFTLKDENSQISAIMFAGNANSLKFEPQDGMKVLVSGKVSVYESTGTYQIYVNEMMEDGLGNLYLEFEKLKEKLYKEGLFNREHKKPIPKYPERIGVITADTGAAVRDIMSTIKRRYPLCEVILFPTLVQGDGAKDNIVRQIEIADKYNCDTLIVGRGGGSIEDLWAFNEEIVARAIYNAKTPIISAVGHEPDFTIADFVADLRAPTPTGAAEMAVPTILDINNLLNQYKLRLNKNIKTLVNTKFIELKTLKESFVLKNPMSLYEIKEQKLDKLIDSLNYNIKNILDNKKYLLDTGISNLKLMSPITLINNNSNKLKELKINLNNIIEKRIINEKHNLDYIVNTLKLVNPLNILSNGYSLVKKDDKIIKRSKELKKDDLISIKLYEGSINAKVTELEEDKK